MLKGNQKKLDKNKNNRIDSEDFKLLRAGKKRGGVMKAKRGRLAGQDFSERMKNVEKGLINKKTGKPTSMMAMRELKGFKPGELPKEFNKRRAALAGAKEAVKRTRIGRIALGVAGVGLAAKALLDKKRKEAKEKKKNKKGKAIMIIAIGKPKKKMGGGLAAATERLKAQGKMGGGIMKRYNKGGGADMGKHSLSRRDVRMLGKKGTEKLMERREKLSKKMGGGMMKPEKALLGKFLRRKKKATPGMKMVDSSPGGFGLLGRLAKKVGLSQGGGADTGKVGEMKSRATVGLRRIERQRENLKKRIKGTPTFKKLVDKKMGGGMMQPAMPMYKKGTMIKARGGGIAKTKPTKMY